ncbi:MAG: SDR family NAD(P)-dependent oxidoreductase [Desulfobacteraceae bacterium]|jgi:NAD(P)-dependent dehydrogenase (short-subunit alcohol dehydrogenase family)|nr:SDR family NAD(P)-dependent oxidoreductase [Desulfobacteraceae bacterium]
MKEPPVIIVSGASRGLGAAVASWLATAGGRVTLVARHEHRLDPVARQVKALGGEALIIAADVAEADACRRVAEATLERFGRIDALVNNAGVIEPLSRAADADPEAWRYNISVNLLGPFYLARFTLSALRAQRGRIVNVSSGAANHPISAASAYCAAKAGLTHLSRVLAAEEPDVTVMAMRPGVVDTDMQVFLRQQGPAAMPPAEAEYYARLKPDGKLEPAWMPARVIAWMALAAPASYSGEFFDYDDPRLVKPAVELLGDESPF